MFKNCCGCPGKNGSRKESEEDDDEDEKKEEEPGTEVIEVTEQKGGEPAKVVTIAETVKVVTLEDDSKVEDSKEVEVAVESKETVKDEEVEKPAAAKKKFKPRLSISNEVRIIPSNFPECADDYPDEEETEPLRDREEEEEESKKEEEEEEEEVRVRRISVKDIDGKIIRKSKSSEDSRRLSIDGEFRPISPLSDEVFAPGAKSHLEHPLGNLGVKIDHPFCTNLDVQSSPIRQASAHSQKRKSMPAVLPRWVSEEDEAGGAQEPPVTPVARDELALRRHRFFAELLAVAQAATEHKVRFDPFGPSIQLLSEGEPKVSQAQSKEFESLLTRLEDITSRLEKTVPLLEKRAEEYERSIVVTKSLEDLLDEHLTPTEKENLNLLINGQQSLAEDESKVDSIEEEKDGFIFISPDSSADFDELSEKDLLSFGEDKVVPETEKSQNNFGSEGSENSSASQNTVVARVVEEEEEEVVVVKEEEERGKKEERETGDCSYEVKKEEKDSGAEGSRSSVGEKTDMTNNQSSLNMSVQGFQQILQGPFASYLQISSQIGGDVAEHAKIVQDAFQAQLQYLSLAAQSGKPSQTEEMKLLQPTSQRIEAIQNYREKHRTSNYFNHLSAISESIPALGWVTVSPAPAPYVKEMNDAGQFYTNRVLKDWKEKDKIHVEWTKAWIQTLQELQMFVKQYHTTGLVWGGTSAPRMGGAPPPPPGGMPPPPPMLDLGDVAPSGPGQDRSALFAEINQGENITRNLKKVTADMQTHKNPTIRAGPAPFKGPPSSITNQVPKPFKAPSPPEKPPKFTREGKKWFIEHQKGNHQLVVENAEMNNVVYVFKCSDSTLVVKGKVNSIFLDSCRKTAVVFDSVVSSIEFVNCQSVQMQVLGTVPTISVDKTDGCQMYLSQDSINVEIVSSKSSEMNVLVPTGSGDFKEFPVPEQFKTTVSKQGLTTTAVESKG